MSVKELIEALQNIAEKDQEKQVYICNSYDGGADEISTITVSKNYGIIRIDA